MTRNFQSAGRSVALASSGMAATSSPAATLAALDVLKAGGNAVDAAVTASAVLCVTEPHMTGIGGDCFALIGLPDGSIHGLNGSGRSAANASQRWFADQGLSSIDPHSVHAVTVPGAIDAWDSLLHRFGKQSLSECLQPAIALADSGHPTQPRVAYDWPADVTMLQDDPGSRQHYLLRGQAPALGDVMRYPALAQTLRQIAQGGRDAFYEGDIASDIITTLQQRGSLLDKSDFASTKASWVEPLSTDFAGARIAEIPPNGQGLTVLIALNILARLPVASLDPEAPLRRHFEIEALKRAWHLRNRHIADPQTADIPVAELLSSTFADRLAASIDPDRASDISISLPPSDTVYLTVIDKNRMAVSFINSIYWSFGSGITTARTGIVLQNRGADFSLDPAHPNCIGPSKRPLHTIIPAMAARNGRIDMSFGVMGGDFQPMGHVNVVLNRYAFGMDPQTALDFPRLVPENGTVLCEAGITPEVRNDLSRRGHRMADAEHPLGGGQAIAIDHARQLLLGGSDPRKDGCALGF